MGKRVFFSLKNICIGGVALVGVPTSKRDKVTYNWQRQEKINFFATFTCFYMGTRFFIRVYGPVMLPHLLANFRVEWVSYPGLSGKTHDDAKVFVLRKVE